MAHAGGPQEMSPANAGGEPLVDEHSGLVGLARRGDVVPVLAAGTTYPIFGAWDELFKALWSTASSTQQSDDGSAGLGAPSGDDMADVDRLRRLLGDHWVAEVIKAWLSGCLDRHRLGSGKGAAHGDVAAWLRETDTLRLQRQIGGAGFPLVVTTNFDECIEGCCSVLGGRPFYRRDLRGDAQESAVRAALAARAPDGPPLLLKIQGDVTREGVSELVMGYAGHDDYGQELGPLGELLRQRGATCVFSGASLCAEANWELILQTLFLPNWGTHYRIAIECFPGSQRRTAELWDRYCIKTLVVPDVPAAECLWAELCAAAAEGSRHP